MQAVTLYPDSLEDLQRETGRQYEILSGRISGGVSIIQWEQLGRELSADRIKRFHLGPLSIEFLPFGTKYLIYEIRAEAVKLGANTLIEYSNNGKVWGHRDFGIPVRVIKPQL